MYAELHLHTCYSFLDGASQPEELAERAAQLGYRALAVTDHDGLYGAMAFAKACAAVDVRPITGVELTLRHGLHDADSGPVHLTLLAESSRDLRPSVIHRKVIGAFRSDWGAEASAIRTSILATARKQGQNLFAVFLAIAGSSPLQAIPAPT